MSILLFFGDKIIPYQDQPYKGPGRILKEYIDPTTPETAFMKSAINSAAKSVVTRVSNRLKVKGGAPEFDDFDADYKSGKIIKGGRKYGRGNGNDRNRKGDGKANPDSNSKSAAERNTSRGYQAQSGTSCISINSGISSGLTVNTRIVALDYTPLYLSSGYLFKITDSNIDNSSPYFDQLKNIIYPLVEQVISNRIQRYAGRYVNDKDFINYISSVVEALQVYYCVDNVLAYGSNTTRDNINVGMEYLRSKLSSEALVEFNLLREILCTCACPPNLLNYIRFMCQSFRTSDAPHSPIIKLNIGGMFDEEWTNGSTHIIDIIRKRRIDIIQNNKMVSYLNQAFPNWSIISPPESSNLACFNISFMTFWHNQNCCYLSTSSSNKGNFEYSIQVDSLDTYTDYQIMQKDTEVDGLLFVSQTYNVPLENKKSLNSYWGLWQPLATLDGKQILPGRPFDTFNIKCFYTDGTIKSVTDEVTLGSSGIYNLVTYSGSSGSFVSSRIKFGTYGFVKLQNISVRMQTEAFNNSLRYLFD